MRSADELIADLAEAAIGGHTHAAVTRRVAEALGRHLPLRRIELAWCDPKATRALATVATKKRGVWGTESASRRLRGTLIERVVRGARPHREARRVVLPLTAGPGDPGYADLTLGGDLSPAIVEALPSVGRVLRAAHRNCDLIGRVAALSRRAHSQNAKLRDELTRLSRTPRVVAESPAMRDLLERLDAVATHDTSVLLLGESGTGKSLLARRVHERSPRASGPFVAVNCGALPESLTESELFGHSEGAFTGASRARRGRFARASGGTIFLDEVAELSVAAQAKLLRVLQEGIIEPLGSERDVSVDVRVIAATNRDLERRVSEGAFREDLFYRLNVFPLVVPPLRERTEDMPALVAQLLAEIGARLNTQTARASRGTLAGLASRRWPGNVRQLRNTLERAAILSKSKWLQVSDELSASTRPAASATPRTFEAAVRACLEDALRTAGGKLYGPGGAAEALGLNPSTLQTKMRKLGIRRERFLRVD